MNFKKSGGGQKNGFINILFNGSETLEPHPKAREEHQFNRFIQEHVFIPRNRIKNVKILKINDTIYTNLNSLKTNHIKRMFIDGSKVRELTPNREILTQDQARKTFNRALSPELVSKRSRQHRRNLSYFQQKWQGSEQNNEDEFKEQKSQQTPQQVLFMSMQQKSLEESTTSSSNRNIRISLRYKKIEKKVEPTKQMALELKKQMLRYYSNPPGSPENISAKAYIIYEYRSECKAQKNIGKSLHAAFNTKINVEIASLTKIMTCILAIQLCDKFKVDMNKSFVKISGFETKIQGTTAQLQADQCYSMEQLLYGLMLPSGNDASLAISAFCGELLQKNAKGFTHEQVNKKVYSRKFVMQMNKKCNELGMKRTIYSNSHGLANLLNKSCVSDQVILISYALQNARFRKIVSSQSYEAVTTKQLPQGRMVARTIRWQNTHKLVLNRPELYLGIKTGTTDAAGPCLASLVSIKNREFIIIVLNSRSSKWRYKDTQQLRQWLCAKEKL